MAEPLLLIPGMMCDARLYGPQIAEFSAERAVHIAPISEGETVEEMAQSVLDTAPDRFALAGLSMGGIVAMEVMRRAPKRVTRIALMDTNSQSETPHVAAAREPLIVAARTGRLDEAMEQSLLPEFFYPGSVREEVMALMHDMAQALGPEVFVRQCRALQRRPDQQKTLRQVRAPALVLCGEEDGLTPVRRHDFMANLIPYAKLVIVPFAGHVPVLENPDFTNAALREWLSAPLVLR